MNRPIRILHTADWHLGKELKGQGPDPGDRAGPRGHRRAGGRARGGPGPGHGGPAGPPPALFGGGGGLGGFCPALCTRRGSPVSSLRETTTPGSALSGSAVPCWRARLRCEGGWPWRTRVVWWSSMACFALVPFVLERRLVKTLEDKGEERRAAYGERMGRLLAHFGADVVLGHFPVAGSRPGEGSSPSTWRTPTPYPPGCFRAPATSPWGICTECRR